MQRTLPTVALALTCFGFGGSFLAAQEWTWPEKPENLKVLPADWPGSRLGPPMRGFTRALGVTCAYCHVGEEGQPLSTYDFASDANPNKDRAREMLRMLRSVNDHLRKVEISGRQRVNMWCHTCHRGRPRPMTLAEEMREVYQREGVTGALAQYANLKREYYGKGAYDFSESALNSMGYELLRGDHLADALQVFERNTQEFPDSGNVWDSLGEAHMKSGNRTEAIRCYTRALELDPGNENARTMLAKLKEGGQ